MSPPPPQPPSPVKPHPVLMYMLSSKAFGEKIFNFTKMNYYKGRKYYILEKVGWDTCETKVRWNVILNHNTPSLQVAG